MKLLFPLAFCALLVGCDSPEAPDSTDNRFVVYPNPAHIQAIVMVNEQSSPYTVKVINNRGKIIIDTESSGAAQLYFSLPEAGTYYVIFEANGTKGTKTLISL